MSFSEKIASLMARPGQDVVPKDDVPWWLKYGSRGLGTVGAVLAICFGLWNCILIVFANVDCLLSGLWQMIAGFLVMICEAPCCCMFIDFVQQLSATIENRPYWNKAVVYIGIAIPPIVLCPGLGSIFGSGLIFGTGILYGMMSLGRKGSRDDMAAMAGGSTPPGAGTGSAVGTDHHVTLMEDPDVWRPNQIYRASAEEMRSAAVATGSTPIGSGTSSGMKANLVENATPMSFTGVPTFDSNV